MVHSTGRGQYDEVVEALALGEAESGRWQVLPYIDSMGEALAAADLVLSRAGASSIAEIAALCVPSVLVPYPLATGDHQTANARYLVDAGAAPSSTRRSSRSWTTPPAARPCAPPPTGWGRPWPPPRSQTKWRGPPPRGRARQSARVDAARRARAALPDFEER